MVCILDPKIRKEIDKEVYGKKCKHENGWITKEEIVIDTELVNDNNIVECECNNLCGERRTFKFDVINVEEVKND